MVLEVDNRLTSPQLHEITSGRQKLQALVAVQWHRRLIGPLGLGVAHLEWASSIAGNVRVARLRRPRHEMTIERVSDLIENAFGPQAREHQG